VILRGHAHAIWSAFFSPCGSQILTCSADEPARLWSCEAIECLAPQGLDDGVLVLTKCLELQDHTTGTNSAVFSPDGKLVLTSSDNGTVRLWSSGTGECLTVLQGHDECAVLSTFSTDGTSIMTHAPLVPTKFWRCDTGECVATFEPEKLPAVMSPWNWGRY
jgi:WD40 repeat protein